MCHRDSKVLTLTVLAGKDLPADEACEMMTGDVDEELDDLTAIMCQASIASCMQAYNTRIHGAGARHCLATCPPLLCMPLAISLSHGKGDLFKMCVL